MNERIKDILAQPVFERLNDWVNIGPVQRATLEEFAGQLIKECVKQIQQQVSLKYKDSESYDAQNEEWVTGHYAGSLLSRVVIAQHFGVEE